jgi:hypothetical protein
VTNANTIRAVVGSGASGAVIVAVNTDTAYAYGFTYSNSTPPPPPPVRRPLLYYITPAHAAKGAIVTIHGAYLDSVNAISFGGTASQSFNIGSDSSITAVIGTGSSGNVIVRSQYGADTLYDSFRFDSTIVTPPGDTTVMPPGDTTVTPPVIPPVMHAPVMNGFTPKHAAQGATVTISGAYLDSVSSVSFGGVTAQSFTVVSSGMVRAVVGAGASGNIFVSTRLTNDSIGGFLFDETSPPAVSAPFQLVQFSGTAYSNQPVLSWSVKHDSSIANYGILHGTDTSHLTLLANIPAKWKDTANYTFTDINSSNGVNYYRLQITDIRMNITYSPVIAVQLAGVSPTLTMYPNPVTGSYVTVNLPSVTAPSQFQVVDMSGNVLQLVPVAAGTPQVKIKVMNMNRGMYKITWSDGSNFSYQTVLILK